MYMHGFIFLFVYNGLCIFSACIYFLHCSDMIYPNNYSIFCKLLNYNLSKDWIFVFILLGLSCERTRRRRREWMSSSLLFAFSFFSTHPPKNSSHELTSLCQRHSNNNQIIVSTFSLALLPNKSLSSCFDCLLLQPAVPPHRLHQV